MMVSLKETKKKDLSNLISKTVNKNFMKIRTLISNQENGGSIIWVNVWCFILSAY